MNTEASLIFIVSSFCLAAVLIMMRDRIPEKLRRPMAVLTIFLVLFAFFIVVYAFMKMGT